MLLVFFFFKQKTAYEMRISDWSSDVCSSDLLVVPGYLVWCALAYALAGSWLSWRVGRPLVALNAERYAREADFRFALVHTNEAAESIGLSAGEQDARRGLGAALERVLAAKRRLAKRLANPTAVTAGYGWMALVVPIFAHPPGYCQGKNSGQRPVGQRRGRTVKL